MPIVSREPEQITALATGALPEPSNDVQPEGSVLGAAFRQGNLIGSALTRWHNFGGVTNDPDPGYSAWDEIKGTPYEEHWSSFAVSNNRNYTQSLKRQIDQEEEDRRTLAAGGWTSTLAQLGAGLVDPTILIPVGGEVTKGIQGYRIARAAAGTAIAGGISTAAQETGLQLTQEERPLSESAINVGFGTVLSGLLGGGVAALLSKPERQTAEKAFNKLLADAGNDNVTVGRASAGAAATSHSLGLDALSVDGGAAGQIAEKTQFLNPGLRLNHSPSGVARQVGQELAEGSVYQTGHAEGLTTGPAVERLAAVTERARTADGMTKLNEAYKDMKRAGLGMTFDEFDDAVGRAMRNEDVGENEFISRAARDLRGSIVEPFFEDGKAVGLYDDTDKAAFAPSYFPRQYRTKVLIAKEPEIKGQWKDYMAGMIRRQYADAAEGLRSKLDDLDRSADLPSEVTSPKFKKWFTGSKLVEEGKPIRLYHGGDEPITAVDMDKGSQGVFWATTSRESIERGESGATSSAHITELYANLKNPAGWDEYEKYSIAELEAKGYDGVVLPDGEKSDVIVFHPDQVRIAKAGDAPRAPEELKARRDKALRKFLDRWEVKNLGEGVDPLTPSAAPDFGDMARLIVDDVYDKLTGRDYGASGSVAPEYMTPIERGPVKERTLPIPDWLLTQQGVLENRASDVLRRYSRTLAADVELTRKFGSPRMDEQLKKIADEYAQLREGVTDPKELKRLNDRQAADQRDIEALRDIIRGSYKREANSNGWARVSRVAGQYNFIRQLGGVIVSSLSDIMRPAMVHGLGRYMTEGVAPLIKNFEAVKLSTKEAKLAGVVVERVLNHRVMAISGMADPFERGTAIERVMEGASRFASKWTGMPIWNDSMKAISSILSQNRILSGEADRRTLAFLGIDPATEDAIRAEFKAHGEVLDGVHVAHTERWTNQDAIRAFRAAVGKDVDSTIVTPGAADAPLLSHTPTGRLLLQFRSYTLASHQKVLLRGLQEGKGKFVSGMVGMTSLGMLSAMLKAWRAGENRWEKFKKASENPGYVIGEGLDNAGVFALGFDASNTIEKLGEPMHFSFNPLKTPMMAAGQWANPKASEQGKSIRYSSRGPLGALLGPTAGLTEDVFQAGAGASDKLSGKPVPKSEVSAAWRLLPFNSFYGMREAIQAVNGDSPYLQDNSVEMVPVTTDH